MSKPFILFLLPNNARHVKDTILHVPGETMA
jgi:hypothetical protein